MPRDVRARAAMPITPAAIRMGERDDLVEVALDRHLKSGKIDTVRLDLDDAVALAAELLTAVTLIKDREANRQRRARS